MLQCRDLKKERRDKERKLKEAAQNFGEQRKPKQTQRTERIRFSVQRARGSGQIPQGLLQGTEPAGFEKHDGDAGKQSCDAAGAAGAAGAATLVCAGPGCA